MKRVLLLVAAAAAIAAVFAAVPFGAASDDGKRFVIGEQVHFTSQGAGVGTFSIAGAFSGSGSETVAFTVTPGKDDSLVVTGSETLTGSLGTITTSFRVTSFPASKPRQIEEGWAVVSSATGAYASLVKTKLKPLGVLDFTANPPTLIQTLDSRRSED